MPDLTILAFDVADRYRNPAVILADGFIGQMMEPLDLEFHEAAMPAKSWAGQGTPEPRNTLGSSIYLEPDQLEAHQRKLEQKYRLAEKLEPRSESYETTDADVLLVGYGITARVLRSVVEEGR